MFNQSNGEDGRHQHYIYIYIYIYIVEIMVHVPRTKWLLRTCPLWELSVKYSQ